MKAICICTTGRIDYVRQCLDSLRENKTDGWKLHVSMELGFPEVHELIRSVNFMPVVSWINGRRLGPELNTFVAQWTAIACDEASALLYFDDDMILSPDAIEMCDWYLNQLPLLDPEKYAGICLCSRDPNNPERPNSISPNDTWQGLVGQGYCYTRAQWFAFVKRNFWVHYPHFGGDGYDWALAHMALDTKRTILRPRLSRSRHIGAEGFHGGGNVFPDAISHQRNTQFVLEEK